MGVHVSLRAHYAADSSDRSMPMPYHQAVTLGEGRTPCTSHPGLAQALGLAALHIKDESVNPTGSHKDRMSALGVTQALDEGCHTVVLASSGNAAVSAAHYARAVGLQCEVATYAKLPAPYAEALDALGAKRFAFDDNTQRWAFVRQRAALAGHLALTNFHVPALGSAPLAIEGYKAIAQECWDQSYLPTDVVVPTARGDLAWGIWAGFAALHAHGHTTRVPRLWIVEPFARLSQVLAGASLHADFSGQTAQFSTAGSTVTYLQWQAAVASSGGAVVVTDAQARAARSALVAEGIQPELCAAAGHAAVLQLRRQHRIGQDANVMLLMTAKATRDPSWPDSHDSNDHPTYPSAGHTP
jgi:threonine synthase